MPGGITLKESDPIDIPTPDTNKDTIFIDNTVIPPAPAYKDDVGVTRALTGSAGSIGPIGPLGPQGLDGEDGDFFIALPGPQGNPGNIGLTGDAGPVGPMMVVQDGIDGEDGISIPGPAGVDGGGGAWVLAASSSPVAQATVDFIGLAGATDIRILLVGMTLSLSGEIQLRVSIDNGANFLSTSGDYVAVSGVGTPTNVAMLRFYAANATTAKSGEISITGCNLATAPKVARSNLFSTDSIHLSYIPTLNAINAIRVFSTTGTMSAGTIYVFTR